MSVTGAPVCEHGYQVAIVDNAVRHVATHGVCLPNDQVWRALRDEAADPDRVTLRSMARGAWE